MISRHTCIHLLIIDKHVHKCMYMDKYIHIHLHTHTYIREQVNHPDHIMCIPYGHAAWKDQQIFFPKVTAKFVYVRDGTDSFAYVSQKYTVYVCMYVCMNRYMFCVYVCFSKPAKFVYVRDGTDSFAYVSQKYTVYVCMHVCVNKYVFCVNVSMYVSLKQR